MTPRTVQHRLNKHGLTGRSLAKKPLLTKRHQKTRLDLAKKYQNWTQEDWRRVLWSDESKINIHGSDGRRWTWRRRGQQLRQKHVTQTVKHDKCVMVWGCFSSAGVGEIFIIEDTLNSARYIRILSSFMLPSARQLIGKNFVFQQDNDPKHTAKNTKAWLKDKNIECLDWPAQSPDLNPIENLWAELKKKIRAKNLKNISELTSCLKECWSSISEEYCKKLVDSMPNRIDQVINNKGLWTKY